MDLRQLFTSLQPGQTTQTQTQTNTLTFSKCPGLLRKTGRWWVPNDKEALEITYCDYCKRTQDITGCVQYTMGHRNKCNCDSYLLSKNIEKSLFTISFWNKDLQTHYPAVDDDIVELPSNTEFAFLIDSKLPLNQFFRVDVKYGNSSAEFKTIYGQSNILYKYNLLVKGTITEPALNERFLYVDKGGMSDDDWELIDDDVSDILELNIYVYKEIEANHKTSNSQFLGNFEFSNALNQSFVVRPKKITDPDPCTTAVTLSLYNADVENTPLKTTIQLNKDYVAVNKKPIQLKIKLKPKGTVEETDKNNLSLIRERKKEHKADLLAQINRLKILNKSALATKKKAELRLNTLDREITELSAELSLHMLAESNTTYTGKEEESESDKSEQENEAVVESDTDSDNIIIADTKNTEYLDEEDIGALEEMMGDESDTDSELADEPVGNEITIIAEFELDNADNNQSSMENID